MKEQFLEELKDEIQKGVLKRGHPFRYTTMASVVDNTPQTRTVVLRRVSTDLDLFIYTDERSDKISQIRKNNKVSFLFYHPKKLLQIRIDGLAHIITDEAELKKYWSGIPTNSRADYTTITAPGSTLKNPDNVTYLEDEHHFCILKIIPTTMEYLKLKRPNHIRIKFEKNDSDWEGSFLVP